MLGRTSLAGDSYIQAVFPDGSTLANPTKVTRKLLEKAGCTTLHSDLRAVLYVEDDELDVMLMRRAWRKVGLRNPLHVVMDGYEAQSYLSGTAYYANRAVHPMPSLVLLDLKLPGFTGLDLLKWIRGHATLHALRVILFSSSSLSNDRQRAEGLGANAYWIKPLDPRELEEMVLSLKQLWL